MKKIILSLTVIVFICGVIFAGGLHFGMPSAVKSKVKELDKKVKEKKEEAITVQISGTAAKGKPIASVTVSIKDANGSPKSGTTGTDGKFTADVTELTFPCLLKVTEGTTTYFSVANSSGTCNIQPFTDLVVRAYFRSNRGITDMNNAFENNYDSLGTLPSSEVVNAIKATVVNIIGSILERQGINPLTYDMFTTPFDANSTGFDKAIEETQITANVTFSTVTIKDTTTDIIISTITPTINDTSAPSVPAGLSASGVSAASIKLQWNPSPETDVAGYAIYRNGVKIAAVPYTFYVDVGLTYGTEYSYQVEAFDWAGNTSAKTSAVSASTLSEFTIAATANVEMPGWSAYDGTNYLTTFAEKDGTGNFALKAQFVSGSGELVGSAISVGEYTSPDTESLVAFDGQNYLMVWDSTSTVGIKGMFISPSGTVETPFVINSSTGNEPFDLAFDGTNYLVVWDDTRGCEGGGEEYRDYRDVYGQLISTDTTGVLVGSEIAICTAAKIQKEPHLAYGIGKYLVAWWDERDGVYDGTDIYGQFVDTSGTLDGGNFPIDVNNYPSDNPLFVAFDGTNFLVTFHDEVNNEWDLYARFVSQSGDVSSRRITISNKPGNQHIPVPVFDGTKYLITWIDGIASAFPSSRARFFDTSGNTLGQELTLLAKKGSENTIFSHCICDGGKYFLIIWRGYLSEEEFNIIDGDIYGMFINP